MRTGLTGTIVEINGIDNDTTETLFFGVIDLCERRDERIFIVNDVVTFNSILERSS